MNKAKPLVVAIIQARMSSTRLPGKALKPILNRPLLQFLIERLQQARKVNKILIATSCDSSDDPIEFFCIEHKLACFRGSLNDVLFRYFQAATEAKTSIIVRITADCPLIDAEIVDRVVAYFLAHSPFIDYASNTLIRTYPRGMDVEVFSIKALEKAHRAASLPYEREHVTPYIYRHQELFRLGNVKQETDQSTLRLTVDTQEDLLLIQHLLEALYSQNPFFGLKDIINYLDKNPHLLKINAHIQQKTS